MIFIPAARAELLDAQDWYEAEAPALGRRFRTEIDNAEATYTLLFKATSGAQSKARIEALEDHMALERRRRSAFLRKTT